MRKDDVSKEDVNGNAIVDIDESKENEEQLRRINTRTRGLKRALQQQREASPPKTQMTVDELILVDIEQDREYWLDRVNGHLEKLLKRDNKKNNI